MKNAVLILAAGAASRMQQAKMLLPFASGNILSHIVAEARAIAPDSICLVTGHYHDEILSKVNTAGLDLVRNGNWKNGMASSIKAGLEALMKKHPDLASVLIAVSDQPYVSHEIFENMIRLQQETKKGIVAAKYGSVTGTPVLFDQKYFNSLLQLQGDKGAKAILQQNPEDMVTVDFPQGAIDIDTPEDYERLCLQTKERNA